MTTARSSVPSVSSPTFMASVATSAAVKQHHCNPHHDFLTDLRLAPEEHKIIIVFGETKGYVAHKAFVRVYKHQMGVEGFDPEVSPKYGFTDKQIKGVSGLRQQFDLKVFLESDAPTEAKAWMYELLANTGFATHFSDEVRHVAEFKRNESSPETQSGNS